MTFLDIDPEWAAWDAGHPGWRASGMAAVERVCARERTFTTADVWSEWQGPSPEEPRRMAEVMADAIAAQLCRRLHPTGGHTRRAGHAGFGSLYEPIPRR